MSYDVQDLKVLSPQEHIRTRKGMYIGEAINPSPLFNEIFDNAIDESNAGYSDLTEIHVDYDCNEYRIIDHGRGFPQGKLTDPNRDKEVEALELLCTSAFSGGKFGGTGGYRIATGLHGLGCLVVNSLSDNFEIKTWRNGSCVTYKSCRGETQELAYSNELEGSSGTQVKFIPDSTMFEDPKIPLSHIILRCKIASAFGMKSTLTVVEDGDSQTIDTSSDIYDLLPEDDEGISEYYRHTFTVKDDSTGESATIALKYTSDTKPYYRGYTNLLNNTNGGTHFRVFDDAVSEAWDKYKIEGIRSSDVYLGLRAVIAVFITDAEFSSQTKERLSVPKQKLDTLKGMIVKEINAWLDSNDDIRNSLIKRFQEYRESQNKLLARKEIKSLLWVNNSKGGTIKRASQVRKLRECDSKIREDTELFIVEGDSALGSAVQARDSHTQAVIPVRGKVFNVARCTNPKDALVNEETRAIINVIGAGIGDDADPDKSRYERIIFMTDADADGFEIAVLLSGMFINLLGPLVKAGMVYVALPPLYGWEDKSGLNFTNTIGDVPESIIKSGKLHRYKGLGEMDPDELRVSTMDPTTRRLLKLEYPQDINAFNNILTSSSAKFQMLVDSDVIRYI